MPYNRCAPGAMADLDILAGHCDCALAAEEELNHFTLTAPAHAPHTEDMRHRIGLQLLCLLGLQWISTATPQAETWSGFQGLVVLLPREVVFQVLELPKLLGLFQ
jgi:hypothetical protein